MVIFSWFILQPSFSLIKDFWQFCCPDGKQIFGRSAQIFSWKLSGNEIDWEGKIEKSKTVVYDDVAKQAKSKAKGVARKKKLHDKHFHSIKRNNESCCEVVGLLASRYIELYCNPVFLKAWN